MFIKNEREKMENYNNDKNTYITRMNKTALSKFDVLKPYLKKKTKVLDYGSGISPEFIKSVQQTGAKYYAYDISPTVQNELANLNIDVITDENLAKSKEKYDIIFMSSVFHEIISYMSRPERTKVLKQIYRNLKKDGKLIIRDWANNNSDNLYTINMKSEKASKEVDRWVKKLKENSIIQNVEKINNKEYKTTEKEAYEVIFHVVWGLQSLERESKEEYNIQDYLEKWLLKPLNFKVSSVIEEKDESYLQYLQKYFILDEVPFNTKCILVLEKEELR
jgi:cheR methyltransferase, SAM binding domain